jgi:septum formation protein
VRWAARQKAEAVARRFPRRVVVGADTEVVLDRRIFGKPQDPKQAREFLAALNGRTHQVYTAVQVINGQTACSASGFSRTDVTMREVSARMIASYARSDEAQDKAGAYAIQGEGRRLVQAIRGPYDNVVGMPVRLLIRLLAECGVPVPAKHPDAAQHPVPAKARRSNPGMRRRSPSR